MPALFTMLSLCTRLQNADFHTAIYKMMIRIAGSYWLLAISILLVPAMNGDLTQIRITIPERINLSVTSMIEI